MGVDMGLKRSPLAGRIRVRVPNRERGISAILCRIGGLFMGYTRCCA